LIITLELEGETIVASNITYDGGPAITPAHSGFDGAYSAEIIGQNINEIDLSRVGGASLTSVAFNEAVADIRAQL
jgi:molybdopterin-binding protein